VASSNSIEQQMTTICLLSKAEVIRRITNFKGRLKLDFSQGYLNGQSIDKLRHILAAAVITISKSA
jgi:hypothetical protein